jgi:hypothetical protein
MLGAWLWHANCSRTWRPLYGRTRKWRETRKTLIYSHYDFGSGLDFNIQQLKKGGLALFGSVSEKVSAGHDTGIHSHEKWTGKGNECRFVCTRENVKFKRRDPLWTNYHLGLQPIKFGTGRLFWAWLIGVSSAHLCNKTFDLVPSVVLLAKTERTSQLADWHVSIALSMSLKNKKERWRYAPSASKNLCTRQTDRCSVWTLLGSWLRTVPGSAYRSPVLY